MHNVPSIKVDSPLPTVNSTESPTATLTPPDSKCTKKRTTPETPRLADVRAHQCARRIGADKPLALAMTHYTCPLSWEDIKELSCY